MYSMTIKANGRLFASVTFVLSTTDEEVREYSGAIKKAVLETAAFPDHFAFVLSHTEVEEVL